MNIFGKIIEIKMNEIGKKICEKRKLKGLSQEELAESAKINLRTVQRIENNESEPHGKTLQLLCDVLEINIEEMTFHHRIREKKNMSNLIVNGLFLILLNFLLMCIFGYLTLEVNANINSRFGALLLSFFIPFFIVWKTPLMRGIERMLKFGSGLIAYIIIVLILINIQTGILTGLFPCLVITLGILFYGKEIFQSKA